jgi:hypothetical protein
MIARLLCRCRVRHWRLAGLIVAKFGLISGRQLCHLRDTGSVRSMASLRVIRPLGALRLCPLRCLSAERYCLVRVVHLGNNDLPALPNTSAKTSTRQAHPVQPERVGIPRSVSLDSEIRMIDRLAPDPPVAPAMSHGRHHEESHEVANEDSEGKPSHCGGG